MAPIKGSVLSHTILSGGKPGLIIYIFNTLIINILVSNTVPMSLKSIQKPFGQLNILVYLYRNERVPAKFLKNRIAINPKTASSALSNLENLKLVRKLSNDDYKLTKKGNEVAESLNQIEKLLSK